MEYHKIKTLFNRDMEGNKKLIVGNYRSKAIEYLKDNTWIFTEKIDGMNMRIIWDGHKFNYKGRTDKAEIPNPLKEQLDILFKNDEVEQLVEQLFGEIEVIFFGEGYGGKIQKGGLYRQQQDFMLFDINIKGRWLDRSEIEEIAIALNLLVVPILLEGTLEDGLEYVLNNENSFIAEKPKRLEGVVGRTSIELTDKFGERVIVKIKSVDFK